MDNPSAFVGVWSDEPGAWWQQWGSDRGGMFNEQVRCMLVKPDGTVYVGGRTSEGFRGFMAYGSSRIDAFLMRFDP